MTTSPATKRSRTSSCRTYPTGRRSSSTTISLSVLSAISFATASIGVLGRQKSTSSRMMAATGGSAASGARLFGSSTAVSSLSVMNRVYRRRWPGSADFGRPSPVPALGYALSSAVICSCRRRSTSCQSSAGSELVAVFWMRLLVREISRSRRRSSTPCAASSA